MSERVLVDIQEGAAPGANTNIAGATVTVPAGITCLRVFVNLATGSVFKAKVYDGTNTSTEKANGAVALVASTGYEFDLLVRPGMVVNFQVETDGIITRLTIIGEQP